MTVPRKLSGASGAVVLTVLVWVLIYVVVRRDRFIVKEDRIEQEIECLENSTLAARVDMLHTLRDMKRNGWIKSYADEMRKINEARCPCDREEDAKL